MAGVSFKTAHDYFGSMVQSYDSLISRAVPRYQEMTARLLDYLPARIDRVLELGCGTGNLSLRLAERYPQARITYVDGSQEMIEVTRSRLEAAHPASAAGARWVCSRFEDLEPALRGATFDLVTSCISLHHVRDKAPLYRTLFGALRPGGTFRFADQLHGGTPANHQINWQRWLEFCRLPGNCAPEEVQSLLDHAEAHDHYTPLAEHFRLLEGAGFAQLDCVWRNWIWAIVTAERP